MTNKRETLARIGGSLGLVTLLEQLAARKTVLVVFTYHRIAVPGAATNPYYDPVVSATPEAFEAQVRFLATRFHILNLQSLIEIVADQALNAKVPSAAGKPLALITFDDGYRDNFETALPILRARRAGDLLHRDRISEYSVPAVVGPCCVCAQANACSAVLPGAISR